MRGNGKDVIRAGWGIYTDFGYTNSNVLFAAADASGTRFGTVFNVEQTRPACAIPTAASIAVGQPLTNIASQNQAQRRRSCRSSASGSIRGSSSRMTRAEQRRLVARADVATR